MAKKNPDKISKEEIAVAKEFRVFRGHKLTRDTVGKLAQSFAIGGTVPEACYYAGIHRDTYYDWCKKFPTLSDYFDSIRQRLPLRAKQNISDAIENKDINMSRWLIERKQPGEYGETVKLEHAGEVLGGSVHEDDAVAIKLFHDTLRENRRKRNLQDAEAKGELIKKNESK